MYTSHLGEDQGRDTHVTRLQADDTYEALSAAESNLRTLVNRVDFGPDLDNAGEKALRYLNYSLSLIEVAMELYEEAREVINAR